MTDCEVGYKKPPKHAQFQKGKSGNPGGRHKPTADVVTAPQRTLGELVTIREHCQTRLTRLEARTPPDGREGYYRRHRRLPKTAAELEEADRNQ